VNGLLVTALGESGEAFLGFSDDALMACKTCRGDEKGTKLASEEVVIGVELPSNLVGCITDKLECVFAKPLRNLLVFGKDGTNVSKA
jgi:hypothetical protein